MGKGALDSTYFGKDKKLVILFMGILLSMGVFLVPTIMAATSPTDPPTAAAGPFINAAEELAGFDVDVDLGTSFAVGSDSDIGLALVAFALDEMHRDSGVTPAAFDVGETVYRDADTSFNVSAGDTRLANAIFANFSNGSVVAAGNPDIGATLVVFATNEKHRDNGVTPAAFDVGETVYRDADTSFNVTAGDTRLANAVGFPNGSVVVVGDTLELLLGGVAFPSPISTVLTSANITAGSVTFTVVSGQLVLDGAKSITATVTGGGVSFPLLLTLDTVSPTVVSKTVSDPLISDSDVPGPFNATTTFSEPMTAGSPTITFSPAVASTLTFTSGAWSVGNTVYNATYAIADGNVTVSSVNFTVSGAADAATNPQVTDTTAMTPFAIDTANPTVVSKTVSDPLISDSDVPGPFNATTTFSEPMTAGSPTITFSPAVASTLTFTSGAWSVGNTVYNATYAIADGNVTVSSVNFTVSGAADAATNPQVTDTTAMTPFAIDTENPVVTPPPNVTFKATSLAGAIVTYAPAAANDTGGTVILPATSITSIPASGSVFPIKLNTITHTAIDAAGNIGVATSTANVFDVRIDNVSPVSQGSQVYVTILDGAKDTSPGASETVSFYARSADGDAAAITGISVNAIAQANSGDPLGFTFRNALNSLEVTSVPTDPTPGAAKLNLGNGGYDTIFVNYTSTDGVVKTVNATTELAGGAGRPASPTDPLRWSSDRYVVESSGTVKIFRGPNSVAGETLTGVTVLSSTDGTQRPVTLTEDGGTDSGLFTTPTTITFSALSSNFTGGLQRLNAPVNAIVTVTCPAAICGSVITKTATIDNSTIPVLGSVSFSSGGAATTNATDTDNDGILNTWETQSSFPGLKVDFFPSASYSIACRPLIDDTAGNPLNSRYANHTTSTAAINASPLIRANGCPSNTQRDIYVEIDYLTGHKPSRDALAQVIDRFATAPDPDGAGPILRGIKLHIQLDENVGFHRDTIPYGTDASPDIEGFQELKTKRFGKDTGERVQAGTNATYISNYLGNKRQVFHYAMFIHSLQGAETTSGRAEIGGNDILVSLGGFDGNIGTVDQQAATFGHELGHNLNLNHGGPPIDIADDPYTGTANDAISINCKPNYLSIMNYALQFKDPVTGRPLDFSRAALPTLDEVGGLSESVGIGFPPVSNATLSEAATTWASAYGPGTPALTGLLSANPNPVDWNRSGGISGSSNLAVHNIPSVGCTDANLRLLVGYNDWAGMALNFRPSSFFSDGLSSFISEADVGSATFTSDVSDDTPFVLNMTAPTAAFAKSTSQSVKGTLEDGNGVGETYTATWVWGDASTNAGTVGPITTPPLGGETRDATVGPNTHSYSNQGRYPLSLTVKDSGTPNLSSTTKFPAYLMVFDKTMTKKVSSSENSKISSPKGAYRGILDNEIGGNTILNGLTGQAELELKVQYNNGVPTGGIDFNFPTTNPKLDFDDAKFAWLVVLTPTTPGDPAAAGTKEIHGKGTGKFKQKAGTFGFVVSAIDGGSTPAKDKFRIRIWDSSKICENVVDGVVLSGPCNEYSKGGIIYDNMCTNPDDNDPATRDISCAPLYVKATTPLTNGGITIS